MRMRDMHAPRAAAILVVLAVLAHGFLVELVASRAHSLGQRFPALAALFLGPAAAPGGPPSVEAFRRAAAARHGVDVLDLGL